MDLKEKLTKKKIVDGSTFKVGMEVTDKDGNYVGKVKKISEKGFLVDRSSQHFEDLFIPYWVCLQTGADHIVLEFGPNEINQKIWRKSAQHG